MKKQSLLLITGGLLAMASCNTEPAANADDSQAKIDSMVNERVEQIRLELQAQNDSLINAMAIYKADSIIAARSGKKVVKKAPVQAAQQTGNSSKEIQEEKQKDGIKSKSDQNKESGSESLKSKSDQNKESGSKKLKDRADK